MDANETSEIYEKSIIDYKSKDQWSKGLDGIGNIPCQNSDVDRDNDNDSQSIIDYENQSGKVISNKESKDVLCLKLLVCFILVASAFTIASIVYIYITRGEASTFESKFHDDANKVLEAIGSSLDRTLGVLDSVNVLFVSHAHRVGDHWPFVTLPDFGSKIAKLFPLTDVLKISVLPMVYPDQRSEWERYSLQMDSWVNESIKLQETWEGFYGQIIYNWTAYGTIYGDAGDIELNVSRVMFPEWQSFPMVPIFYPPYNWDWGSQANPEALLVCTNNRKSVMSYTYMIPNPTDLAAQEESEYFIEYFKDYIRPGENAFEPVIDVLYPIIDDINHVNLQDSNGTKEVVGVLVVSIYWREFIRDILPLDSNGIVVVVHSPCNEPFSYQVNGPNVRYLGVGDNHDIKYDNFKLESRLVDLDSFASQGVLYTGAPIDREFCPYTLHVYPSDDMKSDYTTPNAVIFMISVLLIFLFTSLVFFWYDWKVENRQHRVATIAERSNAIVSSLFPSTVHEQLFTAHDQADTGNQKKVNCNGEGTMSHDRENAQNSCSPIAQLYQDTSVIFMDIVGFTQWSSTHQPGQIFQLLETLYARFDALAKVHGVFKIETIGDCYVAVVGLPKPKKGHAVVMARFGRDCRSAMMEVIQELAVALGPDTLNLSLRVGINSGPTTAGVLRGEKARFQLFGDTVNTASRMESNGESNKIHVSASTAELIVDSGKSHWLIQRSDELPIKGKGMMQTYWCEPIES